MELINSVPTMVAGDRPFWGFIYTFDPYEDRPYLKAVQSMYNQGVRIFSFLLPLSVAWDQPGKYDFSLLDKEIHDRVLDTAPEAIVFPRVFMNTPNWWDEQNPDELIGFRGSRPEFLPFPNEDKLLWRYEMKMYHGTRNPSLASVKWRKDASETMAAYVRHTWGKYPGHFLGYQCAYGSCGEWAPFGCYFDNRYGSYDFSKPMLQSFRNFLISKYQTNAALKKAWNEPAAEIETAEPPTKLQIHKTELGIFKDPKNCRRYFDWVDHFSCELYTSMSHFCRAAKQAAPVDILTGSFAIAAPLQVGCSAYISQIARLHISQILDDDAVDILCTPNNYENRSRGVFSQVPVQSISSRKIFIAENDVRTFLANQGQGQFSAGKDRFCSIASFKRDTFYNLTQGSGHLWWYDFGCGWYLDKSFEEIIAKLVQKFDTIPPADRSGQAEAALVVDEESLCYTEGSSQYFKLWREMLNEHLPRMGAPFDVITTEDMLDRKPYKLYFFRDIFFASYIKTKKIRDFVEKANASCVWFYAAGLLNEDGIDLNGINKLTNIKVNILDFSTSQQLTVSDFNHTITRDVPKTQGTAGNDDLRGIYGPMLFVEDGRAEILGNIESIEKPGIAFKHQGSRFDAWFASPLLSPKLLANLLSAAKVHLYVEHGNVVFGAGNLVTLQSDVTKTIKFRPKLELEKAEDILTGKTYTCIDGAVSFDLTGGEPILLRLYGTN
jgi:hypothetical protein